MAQQKAKNRPFIWSGLILVLSLVLAFVAAHRATNFVQSNDIGIPSVSSAGTPLLSFFGMAVVLGIVLFVVPVSVLKVLLRVLFGFVFAWGAFVVLALLLPLPAAIAVTVVGGLAWLLVPRIWWHDTLLMLSLVSFGVVFGILLPPWTALLFMFVVSIYDLLAVRLGYMQWMSKKLSASDTLPAFVIPKKAPDWNAKMNGSAIKEIFEDRGDKEYSLLGGGDIGFPILLVISVYNASGPGLRDGLVVAGFAVLGLMLAYVVHLVIMKGKATPALPPIFLACLAGFLITRFVLN